MKPQQKKTPDVKPFRLVADILSSGRSIPYIERALSLKPGTLERCSSGKCKPEELALLKILAQFPWVIEVADAEYSKGVADRSVIIKGVEALLKDLKE